MHIPTAKLRAVAEVIRQLRDAVRQYCLAPDKVPVSLDDLSLALDQYYNKRVVTQKVDVSTTYILGMIQHYEDRVEIYIAAGLESSLARLVFAKEVGQWILSDVENVTTDPVDLVSGIIEDQRLRGTTKVKADVLSERLSLIVAIELLFPQELRPAVRRRIDEGTSTLQDEAAWLEIPDFIVEMAISDDYTSSISSVFWKYELAS